MARINETPLDEEQRARAAGSYRWAFAICRQVLRREDYREMDPEITEGAALVGLCLAARSFDPRKGKWPTHAARWIKGQIRDEARVWRRRGLTCRAGGRGGSGPPPDVVPIPPDAASPNR